MCEHCWRDHGSPTHTSPMIEYAAELIGKVSANHDYWGSSSGAGALHLVIDDWNLFDETIDWCISKEIDFSANFAVALDQWKCAVMLRQMPARDRAAALARHEGYDREPDEGDECK